VVRGRDPRCTISNTRAGELGLCPTHRLSSWEKPPLYTLPIVPSAGARWNFTATRWTSPFPKCPRRTASTARAQAKSALKGRRTLPGSLQRLAKVPRNSGGQQGPGKARQSPRCSLESGRALPWPRQSPATVPGHPGEHQGPSRVPEKSSEGPRTHWRTAGLLEKPGKAR